MIYSRPARAQAPKETLGRALVRDFQRNKFRYLMFIPVLAYYIIFQYVPIYGLVIAFKNYMPSQGIFGSQWIGFDNFTRFFNSIYFTRLIRNTVLISFYGLVFGFPAPILFALLLNEVHHRVFKRTVQTITYLPHFISTVVICGMITNFCLKDGLINDIIVFLGGERQNLLMSTHYFRTIYIVSDIWAGVGWGSIIYLSALSAIDVELYDAAIIDGANRFQQAIHVTLPGIVPTIVILFILRVGSLMNVGFEKIFLLYNSTTWEVSDVISTYVYRKGLIDYDYSFSTAIGMFNSAINIMLLVAVNTISRRVNETSLW